MNNLSVMRLVVMVIGLILVICAVGVIGLLWQSKAVPSEFWTIEVSGMTGLLGLLAPSREVTRSPEEAGAP